MVKAPPAASAPTPPLLCSLAQYNKLRLHIIMLIVTVFPDFFLGVPLGRSLFIVDWNVGSLLFPATDYTIGLFPKAARE